MVGTNGETGRGKDKQKVSTLHMEKNVMSARMLEVSIRSRSKRGAPS